MRVPAAVTPLCPSPSLLLLQSVLCLLLAAPSTAPASAPPADQDHVRASPEQLGLRAGGALSLPPPALLERPDRLRDPQPADLNATLLRAKLGRHFDARIMSITRPRSHKHRYNLLDSNEGAANAADAADAALLDDDQVELDEDFPFRRNLRGRLVPVGEMPSSIAELDFRGVRLPDGSRLRTRISGRLRRKLQHFLWAYTACPVARRWRDLGVRFWPRWLKEGHCPESPCSIPAGMRCRPSGTRHQALLRWHCRPAARAATRPATRPASRAARAGMPGPGHCAWIKVEYPVITECSCGCGDDRYS